MKALQIVLIGILLSGCGRVPGIFLSTSAPTQTTTPISAPTFTASPDPAVTQKAILAMTQTAYVGNLQMKSKEQAEVASLALAQFSALLEKIDGTSPEMGDLDLSQAKWAYGPVDAILRNRTSDIVTLYEPGLSLANFIVNIRFVNSPDTNKTDTWDYGILFRSHLADDQYRLIVRSDQSWAVLNANTWMQVAGGRDANIHVAGGESNVIWLVVIGPRAHLFVNDTYLDTLSVKANLTAGDVLPATGLETHEVGKDIEFTDFTVWSLP